MLISDRNNIVEYLQNIIHQHDKVFVLMDFNTEEYCIQILTSLLPFEYTPIVIEAGERFKNIDTVQNIWGKLIESKADRKSLMMNLGGGVVTDIGGFAASCYQRGIDFVNIPTTLMAMVDASIGGKNGIDFKGIKNQVGLFAEPLAEVVIIDFLKSLGEREKISGIAEMLKYGFVADKSFLSLNGDNYLNFIEKAGFIKAKIVAEDPTEQGLRKILNFGHTVGHAWESYYLESENELKHGEAVALGMYCSLWLSMKYLNLKTEWLDCYKSIYQRFFQRVDIKENTFDSLMEIMSHDKKNRDGDLRFVLIKEPEKPVFDVKIETSDAIESLYELKKWQDSLK